MPDRRLSVIVPVRDAIATLPTSLEALLPAAAELDAEVIVVDDASSDGGGALAEERGATVVRTAGPLGPSAARNLGAARSSGAILFFVDADVVIHADAIGRVVRCLDENPHVAAIFGSYDVQPEAEGLVTQYRNLLHHFVHQHGRAEASTFWSGCGAVRREVFDSLGGFDELRYPRCIEDIELGYRMRAAGYSIRLDRELLCRHLKRWTLLSMIRTDVFCRALPWADLDRQRGASADDLNITLGQRVSVALVGLAVAAVSIAPFFPWSLVVGASLLCAVLVLNARLYGFFASQRGLPFAAACVPLHLLYFLYSGTSYLAVALAATAGRRMTDWNGLKPAWGDRKGEDVSG